MDKLYLKKLLQKFLPKQSQSCKFGFESLSTAFLAPSIAPGK